MTGFGPTAVGYFVQGGAKFAGYEFWKKQFVARAGDKDAAVRYRTAIYLGAASVGESVPFSPLTLLSSKTYRLDIFFCRANLRDLGATLALAHRLDSLRTCS
jgi:solute carrier family 25 phosphate transporter 3